MVSNNSAAPHTDAPPSYDQVSGASKTAKASSSTGTSTAATGSSHLGVPSKNEAAQARKSMEDMLRPLPKGWIRQWDPSSQHNFFVDTLASPPRSIWMHPLDDPQYQSEHPDEVRKERERVERERIVHDDTDDEDDHAGTSTSKAKHAASTSGYAAGAAGVAAGSSTSKGTDNPKGLKKLGRSLKDKMTNTTHAEREAKRAAQKEAERRAWEQHQQLRQALNRATQTGQPQLIGRDAQGREIFAQPPPPGAFGGGATLGYSPYQTVNGPYGAYGPYSRPIGPYRRPYGGMAAPLLGGMLLGGLLF
ncbi:hypothetical protein BCV70DRAFT_202557 [Testicularia cyperi]|uniref:WW domain-containing protein n=1 Tax=Testicularia cyperi TaxID=1882483 RepID=A0A317XHR1_9BASI|nr:hypothetical protein BCV70DRAFT_202557 [Testicularia cyperi]